MWTLAIALGIKAAALMLGAFALNLALRRASASTRHLVWTLAVGGALALPVLGLLAPRVEITAPAIISADPAPAHSPAIPAQPSPAPWIAIAWIAGSALVLLRLGAGYFWVRRLAAHGKALDVSTGRVRVIEAQRPSMPAAWGVLRPIILLPQGASAWEPEKLRLVLAHEMTHIRRLDPLWQWLGQFACAAYWWHPLVWFGARAARAERERACDDAVLAAGARGCDYAAHLVDLARLMRARGVVAMADVSHLELRVEAILDPSRSRRAITRKAAAIGALAALCIIAPLAALRAQANRGDAVLAGTVQDASGGRVPGAVVVASNAETHSRDVTSTTDDGRFVFAGLQGGSYTIEIRKPGFAMYRREKVELAANAPAQVSATLEVGQVSENIEVVGKARTAGEPIRSGTPQRIRVGGNVQATRMIYSVRPEYPQELQERGVEGTVVLQAVISKEGVPLSLNVLSTLSDPALAKAARDAVQQWRYQPTLLNGAPVEIVTTVTVQFRLAR